MKPSSNPSDAPGLPRVNPDLVEQEAGALDNVVPSYGYQQLPMIGIGGSAGAIRALQAFFERTPAEPGVALVVVMHLSPDHTSTLPELIQNWTKMRVQPAQDGGKAEPNRVYVIPPGKHLTATNGHFKLTDLDRETGRRVAVDSFFRSLADTHGPHAAAIVLSGADGDGAIGIRRIKERGGLTIVQDPDEAEHNSMPRAAIASGMVDWVLQSAEMPRRILDYFSLEQRLDIPSEEGPQPAAAPRPPTSEAESAMREILVFLRMRTGRDFSYYKRATVVRRISRRMQVNAVVDMASYLSFIRTHPGEAGALLQDLLISVTNFFRDRDAFAEMEKDIPELFEGKSQSDTVRVWSPACATGEEPYSLAMLLIEYARTLDAPPAIQVFGCDIDDEAIKTARAGLYPDGITADVSEDRLRKFFVKEHNGYRVRQEVRENVLFASHDLLKDAPFSRLDLISCRNLLIYLNHDAQLRAFDIFHFALSPEGRLFLGTSDSMEEGSALFRTVNKKSRIFRRKSAPRVGLPVPMGPSTLLAREIEHQAALTHVAALPPRPVMLPPAKFGETAALVAVASRPPAAKGQSRVAWSELHLKLIERFGFPSILVDADHDIHHLSESAGRFLEMTGGEPTMNLLRLIHPALRAELRGALFRASQSEGSAEARHIAVELGGERKLVDLTVHSAAEIAPGFLLVGFVIHGPAPSGKDSPPSAISAEPALLHLEQELEQVKGGLRDTVEQYEASTEELKASNEELQAMNEELRSATEELETGREELQSINEELSTVNQELKGKVEELGHANSDLQNLMSSTAIATVFLDRDMRIKRFTISAAPIFNVIPSDLGRPLADLQPRIDYPQIIDDAHHVIESLTPVEREVGGAGGTFYLARLLPYRTVEDRIAGVVLTFVDITERQRGKRALEDDLKDTERLRAVSETLIRDGDDMKALFQEITSAAIDLTHADSGALQLIDEQGGLPLLATQGLGVEMIGHLSRINARSGSPCGITLGSKRRAIVDFDVVAASDADGSAGWHLKEGLKSAQATPLISRAGNPIGIISTYWKRNYRPSEHELRFLDLLARQAGDAIERLRSDRTRHAQIIEISRLNQALTDSRQPANGGKQGRGPADRDGLPPENGKTGTIAK